MSSGRHHRPALSARNGYNVGAVQQRWRQNHQFTGPGQASPGVIFSARLTSSIIPDTYGSGAGTPTFTRASAAYVADHEGVLRQAIASEARFWGARRVRNQWLQSNALTTAPNTGSLATLTAGQTDRLGGAAATLIVPNNGVALDGANSDGAINQTITKTASVAQRVCFSVEARSNGTSNTARIRENTSVGYIAIFDLVAGTVSYAGGGSSSNFPAGMRSLGGGWWLCWAVYTTSTGAAQSFCLKGGGAGYSNTGDGVSGTLFAFPQFEDVSGQSVETPSERVSTNVLSAPYHGANVDGVRYFDTVRLHTQNQITRSEDFSNAAWTKTASSITGPVAAYDGSLTAWKLVDTVAATQHVFYQGGNTVTNGMPMTVEIDVKRADYRYVELQCKDQSFAQFFSVAFDFDNPTTASMVPAAAGGPAPPTVYSATSLGNGWYRLSLTGSFTISTAQAFIHPLLRNDAGANSFAGTGSSGTLFARATLRFGTPSYLNTYVATTSAAVGPTDTGLTADIGSSTQLGYYSEVAVTNLQANGNDLNAAGWTKSATLTIAAATGPDGISGNYRMTNGAGGTDSLTTTTGWVTTANTDYCTSVYFRSTGSAGWLRILMHEAGLANYYQTWVNTATGALGTQSALGDGSVTARRSTAVGNGWYRVELVGKTTLSRTMLIQLAATNGDNVNTTTNGQTLDVAFVQDEIGVGATSPAFTLRSPDSLTYPAGTAVDPATGTVYAEAAIISPQAPTSGRIVVYAGATNASPLVAGSTYQLQSADGTNFPAVNGAMAQYTSYKCAVTFGGVTQSLARGTPSANSVLSQAYDGAFGSALTTVQIGVLVGSLQYNGTVKNVRIWNGKVTDAQVVAMVG